MVNFAAERPLTLQQLAELLPFSYTTLHRWSKYGHRGVKLETSRFPGKVLTSMEAVHRFTEKLEALDAPAPPVPSSRDDIVDRELREKFGI